MVGQRLKTRPKAAYSDWQGRGTVAAGDVPGAICSKAAQMSSQPEPLKAPFPYPEDRWEGPLPTHPALGGGGGSQGEKGWVEEF